MSACLVEKEALVGLRARTAEATRPEAFHDDTP